MLLDNTDIELLRFTGTVRNLPSDIHISFQFNPFTGTKIAALIQNGLLTGNRNKKSYSLSQKGITTLASLDFSFTLDAKQPSFEKLQRRINSAYALALFRLAGYDIYSGSMFTLGSGAYISAASVCRDTLDNVSTRVFGGSRFTSIGRNDKEGYLVQFTDDGCMYFSNEMRLFNNVLLSSSCKPAVIYTGLSYQSIFDVLLGENALAQGKRNKNEAITYRLALERTTYPLYIIECTDDGAFCLALLREKNYRERLMEFALQNTAHGKAPEVCLAIDAMLGGTPFLICTDMDITRIRAACCFSRSENYPSLAIAAMPQQLPHLERWLTGIFPTEFYCIEQREIETLFPSLHLFDTDTAPYTKGSDEFAEII